ncbi:MAG: hypothetical protein EPO63_08480 [Candidatus Nitrosotenuis sp.]|nr:MAG: hypothetical protein EPO63_08480 [Candidatus Nitrosotenuis sp.]
MRALPDAPRAGVPVPPNTTFLNWTLLIKASIITLFFFASPFTASSGADAAQKQAKISGTQTETHISGTNTAQGGGNGTVHASGAATPAATKAAPAKKAGKKNALFQQPGSTQESSDKNPAPGEVRKPRQPQPATVESPRSPTPPRTPDVPGGK